MAVLKPKKRKILFVSEASFANTGFATIYKNLISRLHKNPKFRIAEFATDTFVNDPRAKDITWRFYANAVDKNDPRYKEYTSHEANKFGRWRFEKVLIDFEPDIVVDLRDPPFFQFESMSPLRDYFHWCIGPTVDSAPQPGEWVDMFLGADSVMPYTNYGFNTLQKENPNIKLYKGYGPGIDLQTFRPKDKAECKKKFGLNPDIKILGYVSRNQARKLMSELLRSFRGVLDKLGRDDVYLHLHTAYPDLKPWNLSKLLIEQKLYNKVFFTYYCVHCQHTQMSLWHGGLSCCGKCGKHKSLHPRTSVGCSQEVMSDIFNMYDAYVQYSNCEGLGVGTLEAAACGIPFAAVNYSAMADLNKNLNGNPIPYSLARDINVDAERAVPDIDQSVEILSNLLGQDKEALQKQGMATRKLAEKHYNWDNIADKWSEFLSNVELIGLQGKWGKQRFVNKPPRIDNGPLDKIYNGLIAAGRPDLINTYFFYDLNERYRIYESGLQQMGISGPQVNQVVNNIANDKKQCVNALNGTIDVQSEDYIRYADIKEISNL